MCILSWHLNNSWQPGTGSNCHVVGVPAIKFCRNRVVSDFSDAFIIRSQMLSQYVPNLVTNPSFSFAFGSKSGVEDLYQLLLIYKDEKIGKMEHNKSEDMSWTTFEFCQHCCVSKIVENVTYILEETPALSCL